MKNLLSMISELLKQHHAKHLAKELAEAKLLNYDQSI